MRFRRLNPIYVVLVFIVTVAVCNFILDKFNFYNFSREYYNNIHLGYGNKKIDLYKEEFSNKSHILFIGGSTLNTAIVPEHLDRIFRDNNNLNLEIARILVGIKGAYILTKFINELLPADNIKYIVVPADKFATSYLASTFIESSLLSYRDVQGLDISINMKIKFFIKYFLAGLNRIINYTVNPNLIETFNNGKYNLDVSTNYDPSLIIQGEHDISEILFNKNIKMSRIKGTSLDLNIARTFFDFCQRRRIVPILFLPNTVREEDTIHWYYKEIQAWRALSTYPVVYVSARQIERLSGLSYTSLFSDPKHFNTQGAHIHSSIFAPALKSLILDMKSNKHKYYYFTK